MVGGRVIGRRLQVTMSSQVPELLQFFARATNDLEVQLKSSDHSTRYQD